MISTILEKLPNSKELILERRNNYLVTYINPYNYLIIAKNISVLRDIDYITFDGILLTVIFRLFRLRNVERLSPDFSSYFLELFESASENNDKIYLIGTEADKVMIAAGNFKKKFKELNIVGFHSGFFSSFQEKTLIENIKESGANIVIVGMGVGKQETFLGNLKKEGWEGRGYACGGFLHQSAEKAVYYPGWVSKLHLRWAYRIYSEPKLINRYCIDYPYSIFFIVKDILAYKSSRKYIS
ncbi:WecB/TagA/CpsF family glycosyltransferase [Leadbetterella byssophila]|uniref:WecB/TagA/CpsF family glycosyltransferase n=1 Tax=Leadbetterella byssophila TaxID=316068 RepID=UPI0039A1FB1E